MKNRLEDILTYLKHDARWLLALILMSYFSTILISDWVFGDYGYIWERWFKIPVWRAKFWDLRVVLQSCDLFRTMGYSFFDKIDHSVIILIYPRLWYLLAYIGLGEKHTIFLAISLLIIYFICIFILIKRLDIKEAILYGVILCSPPIMFGVERCNGDILIFIIISLALFIINKNIYINTLSYSLICIATLLKYYNLFAMVICLKENVKNIIIINTTCLFILVIYFYAFKDDFAYLSNYTTYPCWFSNGVFVYLDYLNALIIKYNYTNFILAEVLFQYRRIVSYIIILLVLVICYALFTKKLRKIVFIDYNYINEFRVGAGIFMGTFLLGNSYDYRLMFVLFTLPQIIDWAKHKNKIGNLSRLALVSILISFNHYYLIDTYTKEHILFHPVIITIKEFCNWLLFAYYFYMVLSTIPRWVKRLV